MTTTEIVRAQLLAIIAQAEAALALIEEPAAPTPATDTACAHPEAKRKACPVGGDPGQYLCTVCRTLVSGKPAEAAA
jgi:hypothetical protein